MTHEANFVFVTLPHAIVPFFNAELENKQKVKTPTLTFPLERRKFYHKSLKASQSF